MKKKFADFVTLQRGFDLPKGEMRAGGIPVVGSTSIIGYHDEHKVEPPGVVTGRSGSLGTVQFIDKRYWPHNTSLWVKDFQGNNPRFVYYCLQGLDLARFNAGAGVPTLNRNHLDTLEVDVPTPLEQRQIASILSAYDDLIVNSQRRVKILESMAQTIYREMFIAYRFPRYRIDQRVDSSLGPIPRGWAVKPVADCFEIVGGGTPARKEVEYWENGSIQWFSPSDLTAAGTMFMDDSRDHITERGLAESSARVFPANCVMITSRATIGAIAINTQEACTNQGFITCIPNERVPLNFLFFWAKENVSTFQLMASGAVFKEISRGVFKTIPFVQPPAEVTLQFEDLVTPLSAQILTLQRQLTNLRRTRDLLLPRLLSGKIDLKAA